MTIVEMKPLAVAQVRVERILAALSPIERATVLAHTLAQLIDLDNRGRAIDELAGHLRAITDAMAEQPAAVNQRE